MTQQTSAAAVRQLDDQKNDVHQYNDQEIDFLLTWARNLLIEYQTAFDRNISLTALISKLLKVVKQECKKPRDHENHNHTPHTKRKSQMRRASLVPGFKG